MSGRSNARSSGAGASDDEVAACQAALLEALARDRELLVQAAWEEIVRRVPEFRHLPQPQVEGVQRTLRTTVTTLLECIAEDRQLTHEETAFLHDIGDRRFRQGIPPDALIAAFKVASETGYSILGGHARELPLSPAVLEAQTVVSVRLLGRLHDVLGAVTAGYNRAPSGDRLRAEAGLVEDLVEGLWPDDATIRARAGELGHDLGRAGSLLVVVPDQHDGATPLNDPIAVLAGRLGAIPGPVKAVPRAHGLVLVPLHTADPQRWQENLNREVTSNVAASHRVIVAAFGPAKGLRGFIRLYEQAIRALPVMGAAGSAKRVLTMDDLWPFLAMSTANGDEGLVEQLVGTVLGPLLQQREDKAQTALATLVCLHDSASREEAADALGLSEKGLQYRLGRIKDKTDLDPTVPKDRTRLDMATVLYRLHPGLPHPGAREWSPEASNPV